jgi:alpha-glucosidase (family GH31 glycosyl hydrolase)
MGRYVWSEQPFEFAFNGAGSLEIVGENIVVGQEGDGLASAFAGRRTGSFRPRAADARIDQELFVRYAQCAALFPMMQFSLSPARVLDQPHIAAVVAAVRLRERLWPELRDLIGHAADTGDPILRPLAFHHPGYESVHDQFLLGPDLLFAPVIDAGAASRQVRLPPGDWRSWSGRLDSGPTEITIEVGLETIPYWRRTPKDGLVEENHLA